MPIGSGISNGIEISVVKQWATGGGTEVGGFLLLETGDYLLLETGDKILKEQQ